ncbi:hypothetical protein ACFSTI_20660 [Rhizorhabdus histidinilytica]
MSTFAAPEAVTVSEMPVARFFRAPGIPGFAQSRRYRSLELTALLIETFSMPQMAVKTSGLSPSPSFTIMKSASVGSDILFLR